MDCCYCLVFLSWDTYEIQVEEQKHTIQTEEYRHLLQIIMIPEYNKKRCAAFLSRLKSIAGESPTSFPDENITMPYLLRIRTEATRLQAEGHIHHTG
ncbi:hypothetical protein TNCV_698501 [Trichonephila clavipes]|nr:hypothetical protein TNCV_698501 [Trichonephila clavipes]